MTTPRSSFRLVLAAALAAGTVVLAGPAGASPAPAVRTCGNADLTASYRGGEGAAGHTYGRIRLTNTSDRSCRVGGFGGLSYVGGGDGTQVGAAADRTGEAAPAVTLRPGQRVVSRVDELDAANFPRKECRPTAVDGFRVYMPDATRSQFVEHTTTGCRDDEVHLLSHRSFRRP
ncbi:DUF4232 domain-containing protein [Nocardioides sp. Leaf285]|uniref:DUF4232 domain-containing protein n=1 Tax=Nocardioides sp. Leaf285 TaxID=1736322 RepID=UPI000702D21A|nr:DUF4232 domain-containing protein [Nocardioides sp. Leaf285]KQP63339.1 hypothetical protein ASF47_14610 [Nocardioides sp. Leaf285]